MNTEALLTAIENQRILVVGDIMLDHYIWGEVSRISPEAPVPIIHVLRESHTAGGASNVALNATSLGAKAALIGSVGEDDAGKHLMNLLQSSNVDVTGCMINSRCSTIVKTRVIARTQQVCRIDRESTRGNYDLASWAELDGNLEAAIAEADAVIISDYAKGAVSQALIDRLIELSREKKTLIALDPKPARHLTFRHIGLITPNRHEALELAGLPEPGFGEAYPLEEICRRIHASLAPELLVITLGADGMAVCREGRIEHVLPTEAREVFDVSGAGDTVIATLTVALAAGATPVEAAQLANRAAGVVVSKIGTATASADEILSANQTPS